MKYVARYLGHPCIGTSRIDSCDGQNAAFHYDAHIGVSGNATRRLSETLPATNFLLRLSNLFRNLILSRFAILVFTPRMILTLILLQKRSGKTTSTGFMILPAIKSVCTAVTGEVL